MGAASREWLRDAVTPEMRDALVDAALANADTMGEALRSYVFTGKGTGCYSTFETRPEFREVEDREAHPLFRWMWGEPPYSEEMDDWGCGPEDRENTTLLSNGWLDVLWHWDGDGTLAFRTHPSGAVLYNSDCKKSYGWRFDGEAA